MQYNKLSNLIQLKANIKAKEIGIKFSNVKKLTKVIKTYIINIESK